MGPTVEKVTISNKFDVDSFFVVDIPIEILLKSRKWIEFKHFYNKEKRGSYELAKKSLELNPH